MRFTHPPYTHRLLVVATRKSFSVSIFGFRFFLFKSPPCFGLKVFVASHTAGSASLIYPRPRLLIIPLFVMKRKRPTFFGRIIFFLPRKSLLRFQIKWCVHTCTWCTAVVVSAFFFSAVQGAYLVSG